MTKMPWYYKGFRWTDKSTGAVSDGMKITSMIMLVGMMGVALVDIVQRRAGFGLIIGALEITEALLAAIIFLMLTDVQRKKAHMSVEFVVTRFPKKAQVIFAVMAILMGIGVCGYLFWLSVPVSHEAWLIKEMRHGVTDTPFWPARFAVSLGLLFFCKNE